MRAIARTTLLSVGLALVGCLAGAVLLAVGKVPTPTWLGGGSGVEAEVEAPARREGAPLGIVAAQRAGSTGYLLIDDFSGDSLWTDLWCPRYYWPGDEFGLDDRGEVNLPDQVSVHDSMLDIHAHRQTTVNPNDPDDRGEDRPFRSGVVTTGMTEAEGGPARLSWQYGLIEVRAKFPAGLGYEYGYWVPTQSKMWPAIWMLAADGTVNDLDSPEIDLIDVFGDSTYVQFSIQNGQITPGAYGGPWQRERIDSPGSVLRYSGAEGWDAEGGPFPVFPPRVEYGGEWHTWGLNWTPDKVEFLVDGVVHGTDVTRVPEKPYYLLINLAVGHREGFWPPGDETPDDEHLYVDWVRLTPNEHTAIWENGVRTYGD
jgi:sialidase-1